MREGDRLVSWLLLQGDALGVGPKVVACSGRRSHEHGAEQVCNVLEGLDEGREAGGGHLVYIPLVAANVVESTLGKPLACVSAATPIIDALTACDMGRGEPEGTKESI